MFSNLFSGFSKKWFIVAAAIVTIITVASIYYYNEFYRQDRVSIEVLSGEVTKTSSNQQSQVSGNSGKLLPGDSLKISKEGVAALIFHDGSVLSFKNGDQIKYNQFQSSDQKNHFGFINLNTNESFEYVTQAYLSKAGAVILGQEDEKLDSNNGTKTKVLGANEKKLSDSEKESLWKNINSCMQSPKEGETFNSTLQRCLELNNLSSISSLELE